MSNSESTFYHMLPKVELHAHLNGSISESTMEGLVSNKGPAVAPDWRLAYKKGDTDSHEGVFKVFKLIHKVTDNTEAVYKVAYDVIHEFAADHVKYLELRTTPRAEPSTGMTKEGYVETVLRAIQDCSQENLDIVVRLLLAIDRRHSVDVAMATVKLAAKYRDSTDGIVVGVDLSGDPSVGYAADFIPALKEARNLGLKLALHLAEEPAPAETMEVFQQVCPDRIGHGTCLQAETGGNEELVQFTRKHNIPIEACLTSNIVGMTVAGYDNHHFKYWYDQGHPCIICTDDKGVFSTSLSEEYSIAAETFELSREHVWDLSYASIDHIFAGDEVKNRLRKKWVDSKQEILAMK